MSVAFVLIGDFQRLPSYIKNASKQPDYNAFHAIVAFSGPAPTQFVDEYSGEIDKVWIDGRGWVLIYTDCVPASVCNGVAAMSADGVHVDSTTRETLQKDMGTSGEGANLVQAQTGARKLWPTFSFILGQSWDTIAKALGTTCYIGEPMNKSRAYQKVTTADLKAFIGSYSNRYLKIPAITLPDTGAADVDLTPYAIKAFDPPIRLAFDAGKHIGYKPDGSKKAYTLGDSSSADSNAEVNIPTGVCQISGHFWYVTNGVWAGYYMPVQDVTPQIPATDCSSEVKAATDPLNAQIATLQDSLKSANAKADQLKQRITIKDAYIGNYPKG
jgi:hypothetical protein